MRQGSGSLAGDRSRGKKHHPAAVGTRAADGDALFDGDALLETEEARKARKAEREKLLREARNAPKTIDKIERALAVLEEDVAAIDARLLACGADVAAAQEVQREKDAKTEKQDLYMAEWERLEGVMEQAEAIMAAAEDP